MLTDAEREELKARPISEEWTEFTEEQLKVRVGIAEKYCQFFLDNDHDASEEAKQQYRDWPMWCFYRDTSGGNPKRSYGVCTYADGTAGLHTVSCHIAFTNDIIGGTPVSQLTKVDRWTADDLVSIQLNSSPGIFADPLGFMILLHSHAR